MAAKPTTDPGLLEARERVHGRRDEANERDALEAPVTFTDAPLPAVRALAAPPVTAVIVIHGMGQQLPFETLDALANGLYREDMRSYGSTGIQSVRVAHVQLENQSLERVEMELRRPGNTTRHVHLYEVYWAPLTEGAVNLGDVVRFLMSAGLNGVKNSLGRFSRWAFGGMREYYVPVHTLLNLLIALSTVVSLVVLNTAITAIAAAKALFSSPPAWLTLKLLEDYTTLLTLVVGILEVFALTIFVGMLLSWGRRRLTLSLSDSGCVRLMLVASVLSVLLFVASIVAIVDAAVAVPVLFRGQATLPSWMTAGARVVQIGQLWVLVAAAIALTIYFVRVVIRSFVAQMKNPTAVHWPAIAAIAFLLLLVFSLGLLYVSFHRYGTAWSGFDRLSILLTWALLVILSLAVRSFLIQYVGDVAAYVQSHKLDRFSEVREKIKERALGIAGAIYAQQSDGSHFDYRKIVLVGHSLGSVIAYDTLNQLLLDDKAISGSGRPWNVADRTSHLLTFGSPLNKIAFIFATQAKKRVMTAARERLAALVQPLVDSATIRAGIRWVNVYSPWDIISGRLDFYDPPSGVPDNPLPVLDDRDTDAVTFLAAHTEYWRNTLVFAWLHAMA